MDRRANHKVWAAIFVFILTAAGAVWDCGTVRGEAQPEYPADGAVIDGSPFGDIIYTKLDFIPGASAVEHTGYFSDNYDDVANRIEDVNLGPPPYPEEPGYEYRYFVGLPAGYIPGDPYTDSLVRGTTYYWTVDERDAEGKIYTGDIWEFTILGFYAFAPDPPNEATLVDTDVLLSWQPGFEIHEHDVYIGTSWEDVNNARYDFNLPMDSNGDPYVGPDEYYITRMEPNVLVTGLAHGVKYYWRIDEVWGRLPFLAPTYYIGDVWSFTTVPHLIYVDVDAGGANDGSNWENAYNYLQDALVEAESVLKPVEIRVAQGVYKPAVYIPPPPMEVDINKQEVGLTTTGREATFQLISGLTIKGGYAGFGEPDPNARDIKAYETILSGDMAGNDVEVNDPCDLPDEPTRADNSYHVVTGSGIDSSAVLDGFTITGGNANEGDTSPAKGGGVYNYNGSPTISNCNIISNSAGWDGGGLYSEDCNSLTVTNCTFIGNQAGWYGGGLYNEDGSNPIITNCTFNGNSSGWSGGGISNYGPILTLTDCLLTENSAGVSGGAICNGYGNLKMTNCTLRRNCANYGGGIYSNDTSATIVYCTLNGNHSGDAGGGMYNYRSDLTLTNCIFSGNSGDGNGGGIYCRNNSLTRVINCTFAVNSALYGTSLACDSDGSDYPSSVQVTNCILWNGGDEVWNNDESTIAITYSNVESSWPGEGNIDADPCFVDSGGWDLRLSPDSPCIDAGYNNAPNLPATDMDGHTRIIDGDCDGSEVVDMGAYEFNYVYLGDFDYNCEVDFADFSIIALAWLTEPADARWNPLCNISTPVDNIIDSRDLRIICENWLAGK